MVAFLGYLDETLPIEETIISAENSATIDANVEICEGTTNPENCVMVSVRQMPSAYKNLKQIVKSAKEVFDDNSLCKAAIIFLFTGCENALLRDPD
jgi:hypothetical protein